MGDYCDGELFKSHGLFAEHPHAFQILLYYDDLEVCNVVGSKAKIHKLSTCSTKVDSLIFKYCIGLFYFTLGNIHPKYRSSLHTIQLLCAVESRVMEKYSINQVLEPFMQDIKQLETVSVFQYIVCKHRVCLYITVTVQ